MSPRTHATVPFACPTFGRLVGLRPRCARRQAVRGYERPNAKLPRCPGPHAEEYEGADSSTCQPAKRGEWASKKCDDKGGHYTAAPLPPCIQADDCNSDSPCTDGRCETTQTHVMEQEESASCDATIIKTRDDDGEPLADTTWGETEDFPADAA